MQHIYWDAGKGSLTAQNTFGGRGNLQLGEGLAAPPQELHPPLSALRASPLLPPLQN